MASGSLATLLFPPFAHAVAFSNTCLLRSAFQLNGSCEACRPFLVGDMPFGCYEASPQEAVKNAVRMMKEGNMDAVKLEGILPTPASSYTVL